MTIHFCLLVYLQGVLEMLWDSFVLWWGYWELQIINYCLQFINVLHCVIYITSINTDTECGKFVGFTPQSFAQWRLWRVKLTIELTGVRLMVSQLLKNSPYLLNSKFHFLVHNSHHLLYPEPRVPAPHPSNPIYLSSSLIAQFINTLIFQETPSFRFSKQNFMCISCLFHKDVLNAQHIGLFTIAIWNAKRLSL